MRGIQTVNRAPAGFSTAIRPPCHPIGDGEAKTGADTHTLGGEARVEDAVDDAIRNVRTIGFYLNPNPVDIRTNAKPNMPIGVYPLTGVQRADSQTVDGYLPHGRSPRRLSGVRSGRVLGSPKSTFWTPLSGNART